MSTRIATQFELPTVFMVPQRGQEHIPTISHDPGQARSRQLDPAGTTVLRHQYRGAMISSLFIDKIIGLPDLDVLVAADVVTAAAWRSTIFSFMTGERRMRRHLRLPMIVDPETGEPVSLEARILSTQERLGIAVEASRRVVAEMVERRKVTPATSHAFARSAGEAALWTSLLPYPELGQSGAPEDVQGEVREIGMQSLLAAQRLGTMLHKNPSFAMLGDPATTEVSMLFARQHRDGAFAAYNEAVAQTNHLVPVS